MSPRYPESSGIPDGLPDRNIHPATAEDNQPVCQQRSANPWLAAGEYGYNITNIGLNIHSDMLCAHGQSAF